MKKLHILAGTALAMLLFVNSARSQNVGIGTVSPDASARLDITASNKGLLIPRVALNGLNDATTVPLPANTLIVYNTNDAIGTGFYYNSGSPNAAVWVKFQTGSGGGGGNGWSLTGNAGIDSTINFLGTTDAHSLAFRVNNGPAGMLGAEGGIALGRGANSLNITAPSVIAIGDSALFNNEDSFQLAIGSQALFSNTTGSENTAIGELSMVNNTTGGANVGVGRFALALNDTGFFNTGIGYQALLSNVADRNTGIGCFALNSNSSGRFNTGIGMQTLFLNETGWGNTGSGFRSLVQNSDGDFNVSAGFQSMFSNTLGSLNTANGMNSLINNTTGNRNTAIGHNALTANITGSFNTAIGDSTNFLGSTALNNTTTIGNGALVAANNTISLGNTAITAIRGQVGFSTFSDGRYKKDVEENVKGLDFILKLRPVTYHYDFEKMRNENYNGVANVNHSSLQMSSLSNTKSVKGRLVPGSNAVSGMIGNRPFNNKNDASLAAYYEEVKKNDGIRYTGFIAQEVEATAKKTGFDFSGVDKPQNANDHYALRYAEFVVPLVKAIQEQQALIDAQNKKIEELTKRLEKIEKQ